MTHARIIRAITCGLAIALVSPSLAGCAGKILRENVLATTQSAFGLQVAQNPQTQMYEAKIGYSRNEFFLVPTDKTIMYETSGGSDEKEKSVQSGASKTANVLAEIQVGGTAKNSEQRVTIYQRLAVGDIAVKSGAAIALYAEDEDVAAQAAAVTGALSLKGSSPETQAGAVMGLLLDAYEAAKTYDAHTREGRFVKRLNEFGGRLVDKVDFVIYKPVLTAFSVEPPSAGTAITDDADGLISYMQQLQDSIRVAKRLQELAQVSPGVVLTDKLQASNPQLTAAGDPGFHARVATDLIALRTILNNKFEQMAASEEVTEILKWYLGEVLGL